VFKWCLLKKGKFLQLKHIQNEFPLETDLEERILNCKTSFWTARYGNDLEVRPKVDIRLCVDYLKDDEKCNGLCGKLHLCSMNLMTRKMCPNPCSKGYSHNPNSKHNRPVVIDSLPTGIHRSNENIDLILRSSFPRMCKAFNDTGKCRKQFCGYLHICFDHLKGFCTGACSLALKSGVSKTIVHDFMRGHNWNVLLNFGFVRGSFNKDELLHNVLLPKHERDDEVQSESENDDTDSIASTTDGLSVASSDVGQASSLKGNKLFESLYRLFPMFTF